MYKKVIAEAKARSEGCTGYQAPDGTCVPCKTPPVALLVDMDGSVSPACDKHAGTASDLNLMVFRGWLYEVLFLGQPS